MGFEISKPSLRESRTIPGEREGFVLPIATSPAMSITYAFSMGTCPVRQRRLLAPRLLHKAAIARKEIDLKETILRPHSACAKPNEQTRSTKPRPTIWRPKESAECTTVPLKRITACASTSKSTKRMAGSATGVGFASILLFATTVQSPVVGGRHSIAPRALAESPDQMSQQIFLVQTTQTALKRSTGLLAKVRPYLLTWSMSREEV